MKPQVAQRTVQILLVEDDNAHAELTRRALVECRVLNQLESTTSGEAAIQRLRDPRQTLPDLVLLDTSLPGISGLKVLEAIRNEPRTAHLPVIMLTDAHDEATISAGYRADVKKLHHQASHRRRLSRSAAEDRILLAEHRAPAHGADPLAPRWPPRHE
ncbi:MAG: response regulator [Pseudomonadota bacterium]|nr:response regulator [Pseudomonadota bacterium]